MLCGVFSFGLGEASGKGLVMAKLSVHENYTVRALPARKCVT